MSRSVGIALGAFAMGIAGCATSARAPGGIRDGQSNARRPEAMSLLGRPLYSDPPSDARARLEADLAAARMSLAEEANDPERVVWVGRRLGYLWRMREAIEVFTQGIEDHPGYAPLYRHRGHRYISLRRFDEAIRDLQRAAELIKGAPVRMEPNGMETSPDAPLSTTAFSVWYHLGLAYYLKGDFEHARDAYRETLNHCGQIDDNIVAATDWLYMTLRALGRDDEAADLLDAITPDMNIISNGAYHRRLLTYKGLLPCDELLSGDASDLDLATMGYGLAQWHHFNGREEQARTLLERLAAGSYWPAFGVIAAEAQLARIRG